MHLMRCHVTHWLQTAMVSAEDLALDIADMEELLSQNNPQNAV